MRAMGGILGRDRETVKTLRNSLVADGIEGDAEFLSETDRASRISFLKSLSVLCVPVETGAAYGTFMVEAWACGVPVVQPRAGGFPELVELTGGGVLYDPGEREEPAASLASVLADRKRLDTLGAAGRSGVEKHLRPDTMAERLEAVYRDAIRTREASRKPQPDAGAGGIA
jgi:glycosyltransferase involved in cell wall biosynthesis